MPAHPFTYSRNGVPSITRESFPITWRDSMSPAMSLQGSAAATPGKSTFVGTAPNELVLNTYTGSQNDRAFGTIQFDHDLSIGSTGGSVTFSPHVHWTCSTTPTTNTFCEWRLCYTFAKPGLSFATAGQFSTVVQTCTGRTTVPASTGAYSHRHLLTELQDFTVASSLVAASAVLVLSVQVSSVSTLDAAPMLLACDVHYQARGGYTNNEYA